MLTKLVIVFLLALIKIGDGVLYLIALIFALINFCFKKVIVNTSNSLKSARKLNRSFKEPNITFSSFKRKTKKRKVKKQNTIFFPQPFLVKFRYFIAGGFFTLLVIGIPLVIYTFIQSLPNPNLLSEQQVPQTTKIYDRNHVLLYQFYANQNRTEVPLSQIPLYLRDATIAIEDKNFYSNPGFDVFAIARSFIADVTGKKLQGGSTITQQLIKSALLTPEESVNRKIKEVALAFWAERIYTKDQILAMYFNQVPYGGTSWGVEAASETYFGKNVGDLDLAQCAFLAGMPQEPTVYSPYGSTPNAWKGRQKDVLMRMYELGYISKKQEQNAVSEQLSFQQPQTPIQAPQFVFYVKDLLVQKYGLPLVEKGGLTVITSLDMKKQDMVQKIVSSEVANDAQFNLSNGAALVTNPANGDILAMVGSSNYYGLDGQVNLTTSLRQPGSSIKVVTYSSALSHGYTAATVIDDSPVSYGDQWGNTYAPVNYDGRFHGALPLRVALANSLNVPAVKTLNSIGIPTMVSLAKQMGITTWGDPSNYGLSITLGAADVKMTDMATVFGVLANGGTRVDLDPLLKVTDANGNVLEQKNTKQLLPQQVLDPGVAYVMGSILADNNARSMEFGPNSPLNIPGFYVSVKTGTTNDIRDNWTDGYTKNYVVTTWVGNNDNTPMSGISSGITGAAPMWHKIMFNLLKGSPNVIPTIPDDIVIKQCYGHPEYFLRGTESSVNCGFFPSISPAQTAKH